MAVEFVKERLAFSPQSNDPFATFQRQLIGAVAELITEGKVQRFGRSIGRRDHVKKAYVSLKPGQELNFSGEAA